MVALVSATGLIFMGLYATELLPKAVQIAKESKQDFSSKLETQRPSERMESNPFRPIGEAAEDPYLDQVNKMLGITEDYVSEPAEIQWSEPEPVQRPEKQKSVFTDSNYIPPATVNTIRMPRSQPQPVQPQQRKQPYVTVVKETKMSCWPFKEGSTECRKYKAQSHQLWRRKCDTGAGDQSHACRQANRYDLR
ncbi:hypothetical protein SAMN05216198_0107 [Halopseudomonas litoralis]|uniref:Uncharacterized protein n=2 Tax=Halopseudomonas litoralis TaxID=797277 RepID=A0A1H1L7M4_9GAMM|nr:hypothetical protein SAMN05216198_0107 [Halopseudomonas litoralis]